MTLDFRWMWIVWIAVFVFLLITNTAAGLGFIMGTAITLLSFLTVYIFEKEE